MVLTIVLVAAFIIFVLGMAIRIVRIAAMPAHVRWEIYPIPAGAGRKMAVMAGEILLLKGVFRHHRSIWLWAWLLHVSLYILIGAAGLSCVALFWGEAREGITRLIEILLWISYTSGILGATGLMLARMMSRRLNPATSLAALFNLAVLLAIFLTGMAYAVLQPSASQTVVAVAGSLLRFGPMPPMNQAAIVHLWLIAFFAAYFPFTQMAHAVMKYFTYHSVLWDDRPNSMSRYLAFPIDWSAPHIKNGSAKTKWSEVVK
jgi:nitrate reductase gamma subunit